MSVDLYIQGYSQNGDDGLPVDDVLAILDIRSEPDEHGVYPLHYDKQNFCDVWLKVDEGRAIAVVVGSPCGHERFWEEMFALLQRGPYVAFMPGSRLFTCKKASPSFCPKAWRKRWDRRNWSRALRS